MPAGRPKKEIDYATVEKLANIQCTQEEIASFLGISSRTLLRDEKFNELFAKGRENGKMSLRRIQWKHAEKSATMAIWLGKQYLGQRDNIEVANTDELNKVKELLTKISDGANNG
jgi:hypothetical protein